MDLQVLCQAFNGADAWHLMALFNAADMPSAGRKQQIFLGHAPSRAQLLQRATKVGLRTDIFSGRH